MNGICENSKNDKNVGVVIRIRDTLLYESHITPEDLRWLISISLTPTVTDMNQWLQGECDHEWVDDWVDVGVESIQKITYCAVCEINHSS